MSAQIIPFPSIDLGLRWKATRNALDADRQVQELGARLAAGDRTAAVPLRRALQRRTRFRAVAVAFGADPTLFDRTQPRGPEGGVRSRTAADGER